MFGHDAANEVHSEGWVLGVLSVLGVESGKQRSNGEHGGANGHGDGVSDSAILH